MFHSGNTASQQVVVRTVKRPSRIGAQGRTTQPSNSVPSTSRLIRSTDGLPASSIRSESVRTVPLAVEGFDPKRQAHVAGLVDPLMLVRSPNDNVNWFHVCSGAPSATYRTGARLTSRAKDARATARWACPTSRAEFPNSKYLIDRRRRWPCLNK